MWFLAKIQIDFTLTKFEKNVSLNLLKKLKDNL